MERLPVDDLTAFHAIVEHGSLRAAARSLGLKPPAVSYRLKSLEARIGAALLLRTTRSVELTDVGRAVLDRTRPALIELAAALNEARGRADVPSGLLRVTLSYVAFRYTLADRLLEFGRRFPGIELDLFFDDGILDLAKRGLHAGIRVGNLIDDQMIAVKLTGPRKIVYFASPDYLERRGRPSEPMDLLGHDCIRYRYVTSGEIMNWPFRDPDGPGRIDVPGSIIVNNTSAMVDAAIQGLGIAWIGESMVGHEIESGRLEVILEDYAVDLEPFYVFFPKEYAQLKILRAFVDFMKEPRERG
jgi:DNA-binding transcriptional LysR family regulator